MNYTNRLRSQQDEHRRATVLQDLKFQLHMLRVLRMERGLPPSTIKPKEEVKRLPGRPKKAAGGRDIIYLHSHIVVPTFAWKRILMEVATKHEMTVDRVVSTSRRKEVVAARNEAMWRMKHEAKMSYPAICRRVGLLDHSSSIHGVRRHQELIDQMEMAE